jgi:hypothetical protein
MTEILFSSRENSELLRLMWPGLDTWSRQWSQLLDVLLALEHAKPTLGLLRGEIDVAIGTRDQPEVIKWPVATDPSGIAALRRQLDAAIRVPEPLELELPCEPMVALPDGALTVTTYDTEDLVEVGDVPLALVDVEHRRVVGTPRRSSDEPLLYLHFSFASHFQQHIAMYVCSKYDLWRRVRFDGEPNAVGEPNSNILRACFVRIAAATGGQLSGMALQVP